jgi:hypothetical protein
MPSSDDNFLNDPLLMAFDALPANKMLHEAQVALLLGCKTRWLEEQRSRGLGFDEPIFRGGHRKRAKQSSFPQFLATAKPDDEWTFVFMGPSRRPIDAISALTQVDVEQIVDAGWLCLNDYADALKAAAVWELNAEEAKRRSDQSLMDTSEAFGATSERNQKRT